MEDPVYQAGCRFPLLLLLALRLLADGDGRSHPATPNTATLDTDITSRSCTYVYQVRHSLVGELLELGADHLEVGVDLCLVGLVHLGDGEESHVCCKGRSVST